MINKTQMHPSDMLRASIRSLHRITATCISSSPPRVDASPPSQGPQISSEIADHGAQPIPACQLFQFVQRPDANKFKANQIDCRFKILMILPLVLSLHPYSNSAKKKTTLILNRELCSTWRIAVKSLSRQNPHPKAGLRRGFCSVLFWRSILQNYNILPAKFK